MSSSDLNTPDRTNHSVCNDCWEVFLTNEDLESHRHHCPSQITKPENPQHEPNETELTVDNDNETPMNHQQSDTTDLTLLTAMQPQEQQTTTVNTQNGNEILAMFDQQMDQMQSGGDVTNLDNFTITITASTILNSYVQQQNEEKSDNQLLFSEQLLKSDSSQSSQQEALLTHCVGENGIINALPVSVIQKTSTTTTKTSSKRKLLPKPSGLYDLHGQEFQCSRCDFVCSNDASYRDHARSHTKVKEFACEYCGITLTKYEQMAKHLDKEHNSDLSYYCYLCYTPVDDKFSLQEHLSYCGKHGEAGKNHQPVVSTALTVPSTSQLLPNLLSGSTVNVKNVITCPKCGQILGTEESLNVSDKPIEHRCEFCSTNLTLMRQTGNTSTSSQSESKFGDMFSQPTDAMNTSQSIPSNTVSTTPLLLYTNTGSFPTTNSSSTLNSTTVDRSSVGNQNQMTVGINTSNGLVVLTLPVVTADKVSSDSSAMTGPLLQLPNGNILLLGSEMAASLNAVGAVQSSLSPTIAPAPPLVPSNDILMTAAAGAGINAPTCDSPGATPLASAFSSLVEDQYELKAKVPRYTCSQCRKTFELYQSWRRHEQKHSAPKKQHTCEICGKIFTRPKQLKEHMMKQHSNADGASEGLNNDVPMIKLGT
uniref:C2H2-type domain-containing protein n=1 Tax=Strigamia maritima TaxID=126957 RepID=T1JFX8_STRMM